jgi:hypothetical protein
MSAVAYSPDSAGASSDQPAYARRESDGLFERSQWTWLISFGVHLALLVGLSLVPVNVKPPDPTRIVATALPTPKVEPLDALQEFEFDEQPHLNVGAKGFAEAGAALSIAPQLADVSEIPQPVETDVIVADIDEIIPVEPNLDITVATGVHFNENLAVRGGMGEAVTAATGAVDRITHEILLSMEERKTLVVWLFDQSPSMVPQRNEIRKRLRKIYEELGAIEAAGHPSFKDRDDQPLLTSVVSFGDSTSLLLRKPTADFAQIESTIDKIPSDDSGTERIFSAIHLAANSFRGMRMPDSRTREPSRNVMLIAFTDEAGDDQMGLEETVKLCRRYQMPVYVVGVPAPFGRKETLVKWVDPDPAYDQTPQWGEVTQGPESLLPERIKLNFSGNREDDEAIDSGFGPFALTRLCIETGGLYFAVHPNRNANRSVSRAETEVFAAHLTHFFDPQVMRRYRPDYVSPGEYSKRVSENKARAALVEAAKRSWASTMPAPNLRFVKQDEGQFVQALTEAQKDAARVEPTLNMLYEQLKIGEADRQRETIPRWQAGYDLAIGRTLAAKVRAEIYNAMLAEAKRGLKPKDPKNNTWVLAPSSKVTAGSQLETQAKKAVTFLERVVAEHPGTPWELLARQELETPVSFEWREEFTDLTPPPPAAASPPPPPTPATDDAARMLARPPVRKIPAKL